MSETVDVPEIKYLSVKEFRELGLLQEINRLILHPLGIALSVQVNEDGTEEFAGIWDYREDSEGIVFADSVINPAAATAVARALEFKGLMRSQRIGCVVQPAPGNVPQLKVSVLEPFTRDTSGGQSTIQSDAPAE